MSDRLFKFQSDLPVSIQEAFDWHLRKGALERLVPPWMKVSFLFPPSTPDQEGKRVGLKVKWGPFSVKWILEHRRFVSEQEFSDVQLEGPFRHYLHRHKFLPSDLLSCKLSDEIIYSFPIPFLSRIIEKEFLRFFSWRHALLREDLKTIDRYPRQPLRILLSGASGFVGSALRAFLSTAGHEVVRLVRKREQVADDAIFWDPVHGEVNKEDFEGFDAVIHLAGASIASGRWTRKSKEQLFLSRCRDTWLLSQILCRLYRPPRTFICASAIGFYGDRGQNELTEESSQGTGFLADLCEKWEKASEAIENRGTRVVHSRFGAVLGAKGGMLRKMLRVYRLGLGGRMGSGRQMVSWIGIDDLLGALYHCLMNESISGPVNCVAPQPVAQEEFARILAKKVGRPAFCHAPSFLLKMGLGEMAKELILSSQNVKPEKLLKTGYAFRYPDLKTALDYVM
ncbi:MAG: TIGR01777 family oxidoreductase [Verrucomicrobia bacterium]|nr:TIGR01777 family oxidoreductase [Verrucomicrobiota bacterium]